MAYFLVERYVPSMSAADLESAMARIDQVAHSDVRHLWTILVAAEDTCLSVFEGPDATAVADANARANFHLDRVVEVTSVEAGQDADRSARPRPGQGRQGRAELAP